MVREELGDTIDIHLGGADLIFPHHENEIAQSEAATGCELARWWLHNGMVNVEGEKMSKSLGNFTTIRALLASGVSPMTLRLFVLQAHYRKPLDFTGEALEAAATGWKGLNAALLLRSSILGAESAGSFSQAESAPSTEVARVPSPEPGTAASSASLLSAEASSSRLSDSPHELLSAELVNLRERFIAAMDDDLNSSAALAVLFELARPLRALANRLERGDQAAAAEAATAAVQARAELLLELAGVLGLVPEAALERSGSEEKAASGAMDLSESEIQEQIEARRAAKAARDFARADAIRAALRAQGIELIDRPGGLTEWLRG